MFRELCQVKALNRRFCRSSRRSPRPSRTHTDWSFWSLWLRGSAASTRSRNEPACPWATRPNTFSACNGQAGNVAASRKEGALPAFRRVGRGASWPRCAMLPNGTSPRCSACWTAISHERDALEPVLREELIDRVQDGLVTLLDVRPGDEFEAGHLPGAINIPLRELEEHLADLPRDQEIIAYCRGPYCVLSFEAVSALRERGFSVRRFEEGYPEWKAAGLPVEVACLGRPLEGR